MGQYIDKAAIKAEIERLQLCTMDEAMNFHSAMAMGEHDILCEVESFLDTLEVKEVDLEKDVTSYIQDNTRNGYFRADIHDVAKHFFELGLKARGE